MDDLPVLELAQVAVVQPRASLDRSQRLASLLAYLAEPATELDSARLGVVPPRLDPDRERVNYWMSPGQLLMHRFQLGQIILGKLAGTYLGHLDDRAMVTIAGWHICNCRR